MKICEIKSDEFKSKLSALYGKGELDFQCSRYEKLAKRFSEEFSEDDVRFFSAPGRTEICGNHTDHNNGKVFAASINLDAVACVSKRSDNFIQFNSEGYEPVKVDISDLSAFDAEAGKTSALIRGICARFKELGYNYGGFNASVTSRVLSGSGLSSSAAIEVLIGTVLSYLYNDGKVSPVEIAKISQYAENVYFKKPCGLMDQTACSVGGFVKIDFKDTEKPEIEKLTFDIEKYGYVLCIVDTGGNHADLTDDYAAIRKEMNAVAECFGKSVLREVPVNDVLENISIIREKVNDRAVERALHFYNENDRVDRMETALKNEDFDAFKSVILESGKSSFMYNQNCFTSSDVLNQPVSLALCIAEKLLGNDGAYRVHGGGFAGTVQIFVPAEKKESFVNSMEKIFGKNSCYILNIRSVGGCEV